MLPRGFPTRAAFRHLDDSHLRGKVVVTDGLSTRTSRAAAIRSIAAAHEGLREASTGSRLQDDDLGLP